MKTKILIRATYILLFAGFTIPNFVSAQNLYGMTEKGGANNDGVIFQYNAATNTYTKKFDFTGANGANPYGSLIYASDGNLYGMTEAGGTSLAGVLFQFNPVISIYTTKFSFGGISGQDPTGTLVQASDGSLYGMTSEGGATNNSGVLFQFNPATSIYTKKIDFAITNGNGAIPQGSLVQATDGDLYGMTYEGGTNGPSGNGVLFQFSPATSAYTKKLDFTGTNGAFPYGTLIQATDGNLYGMTEYGGTNNEGVLFQFNPATSVYTKKLDFTGANGAYPVGSLIQASDGNLYGITQGGGANNEGVLFQFNPATSAYIKKLDFTGTNGQQPFGSLIQASDGNLYGLTHAGGANNEGVLFQFNPLTSIYTIKLNFTGANGANPAYSSLIEIKPTTSLVPTLSQWALITLSVLVLGAGVVFVRGRA